jgi:pSer/pThr/pTyr-binding forkhead associated (FHA) protein
MQTILMTALLAIVTSIVTALVTSRLSIRAERRKWQAQLSLDLSKARAENPKQAAQLSQDFGSTYLVVVAPGSERQKVFLPPSGTIVLGRHASCDICLSNPGLSGRHVAFLCRDNGVWIEDLGSAGGLRLNGERLVRGVELNDKDEIECAGIQIEFHAYRARA